MFPWVELQCKHRSVNWRDCGILFLKFFFLQSFVSVQLVVFTGQSCLWNSADAHFGRGETERGFEFEVSAHNVNEEQCIK